MVAFLYDGEKVYSYELLLESINEGKEYFPLLKTKDVFFYFENLIKGIANNKPLTLLDSDLTPSEIDGLDESLINQPEQLDGYHFENVDMLIDALRNSTSKIRYNGATQEGGAFYQYIDPCSALR